MSDSHTHNILFPKWIRDRVPSVHLGSEVSGRSPTSPISVAFTTERASPGNVAQSRPTAPILAQGPQFPQSRIGIRREVPEIGGLDGGYSQVRNRAGSATSSTAFRENPKSMCRFGMMVARATH